MGPLRQEGTSHQQVQGLHPDVGGLHDSRSCRAHDLRDVAGELPSLPDRLDHAGDSSLGPPQRLRNAHREAGEELPRLLAPHLPSRRPRQVGAPHEVEVEGDHGWRGWLGCFGGIRHGQAVGDVVESASGRRQVLERAGHPPGHRLDGPRQPRSPRHPGGENLLSGHEGVRGRELAGSEGSDKPSRSSQRREARKRKRQSWAEDAGKNAGGNRNSGKGKGGKGLGKSSGSPIVFCLEQWQWTLRRGPTWGSVSSPSEEGTQVYHLRLPGPSFEELSQQEELKARVWGAWALLKMVGLLHSSKVTPENMDGGEAGGSSSSKRSATEHAAGDGAGSTKSRRVELKPANRTLSEDDESTKVKRDVDEDLKEHLKQRVFVFMHHFSGPKDVLGRTVKEEAQGWGIKAE